MQMGGFQGLEKERGEQTFTRYGDSFWDDENIWELNGSGG
jgi:hypothetical protein